MVNTKDKLKYRLEQIGALRSLARLHRNRKLRKKYKQWQVEGKPTPMPDWGKQQVVIDYLKRFGLQMFVETGTYKGRMIYALIPYAKEIYSIELAPIHFENARRRFAGYRHVHLFSGQSGEILQKVLTDVNEPCLFWLDAHFSGGSTAKGDLETPIMQELETILAHPKAKKHVILIDDARCFVGDNDYPTIDGLERFMREHWPDCIFDVSEDIIRIHA